MRFWTPLLLAAVVIACNATDSGEGEGQYQAIGKSGKCVVTNELTGAPLTQAELAKIDDPVAQLILTTEGCPETTSQLMEKFRVADTVGCVDNGKGKEASGVMTALIGEASALTGQPGSYRSVIARDCNGRKPFELLLSGTADKNGVGEEFIELIAHDKTKGVFDYYSQENGKWTFFGTSGDYVSSGYTCKNGQCTPKIAAQARCAGCHPGGGLNMKELHSPWVMWDLGSLAGAPETFKKSPDILGRRGGGIDLEEVRVSPGNQVWVKKRLEILKPKGTQEVLRNLFCTLDMNLQTSNDSKESLSSIPSSVLVDRSWNGGFLQVDSADYKALLTSTASRLPGGQKDTPFSFIYPERAAQDLFFQQELVTQKVVDDDFVKDVLHVDFTRSTYSTARCDLLKLAPTLTADKMTPDAIREGFKKSLVGQTSPAAVQLLANLNAVGDQAAHQTDVDNFFKACAARPKKDLLKDVMIWVSQLRKTVRATSPIIEFAGSMPEDNQPATTAAFDPKTCLLK